MKRRFIAAASLLAAPLLLGSQHAAFAAQTLPEAHATPPASAPDLLPFDVAAHRGGIGLNVESTPQAFAYAMELGVSSLELDVQTTEDGYAVITHDRKTNTSVCREGEPASPNDPDYPYMGKYIKDLTLAQVRTFDCGSTTKPQYPGQIAHPGEPMMLLSEVFDLVKRHGAYDIGLNIEPKVEAGAPDETAPREQFVQVVAEEVRKSGLADQVMIESFDWGALMRMREVMPELPLSALTNGQQFLQVGEEGASPWLGGIDIDDFGGDLVAAVASFGADYLSPVHGDPQDGSVDDADYVPFTTREMVEAAHAAGIKVIPWTVNDTPTLEHLIDLGVDGIITDYPNLLVEALDRRGYTLPPSYSLLDVGAGTVEVIGDARVGSPLSAETAGWRTAGSELSYQWLRGTTEIEGATAPTYEVMDADLGAGLAVRVTLSVPGFESLAVTSEATDAVTARIDDADPTSPETSSPVSSDVSSDLPSHRPSDREEALAETGAERDVRIALGITAGLALATAGLLLRRRARRG